ncbi:MAG TPA: hypothetical protein VGC30_05635 [Dokdonella sp.]
MLSARSFVFARLLPAVLAAAVLPDAAHAASVHVLAGPTTTSSFRWTAALFADVTGDTRDWGPLRWQPAASLGWIAPHHTHEESLDHDVVVGGAGFRLVDWWRGAFFGFEVAAAGGRTDALSSAVQFISTLGWQGDRYEFMVRHISDGSLFGGKNLGESMLLVGVRF